MGHMGHRAPFSPSPPVEATTAHAKADWRFYGILRRYAALCGTMANMVPNTARAA